MIYEKIIDVMGLPFTLIYAVMFLAVIYFVFVSIPKTLRTKYWPKAIGQVTSSKLHESKRITKNGVAITVYSADIEYTYKVNSEDYSSKKIKWVDHRSNNMRHHQELVDTYFIGQRVEVFYNPKKPSIGLLQPGFSAGSLIVFIFFFIGFGSMTFLLLTKL